MVGGVEVEIFDVEQEAGAGFSADQVEKRGVRQMCIRPVEHIGNVFEQERNRNTRLHCADFGDDHLGHRLGSRQRQQIGEVAAGNAGEGKVLAVGGRLESLDDRRNLIEIGEVERCIGADGKPDAVGIEGDAADKIEDFGALRGATVDAMVYGDFEHVDVREVRTRPFGKRGAVPDADARRSRRRQSFLPKACSQADFRLDRTLCRYGAVGGIGPIGGGV